MSLPTFSIVVPTFRRPTALRLGVGALGGLDYDLGRVEIIIIDDASDPRTVALIKEVVAPDLLVKLESQDQRGAACARNRGASLAEGELLLFVDDDIIVARDHLTRHLETREAHGDALVNGAWEFTGEVLDALSKTPFGRFRIDLERQFQEEAQGNRLGDGCVEMPVLGTWDLALRRDLFWHLGGFDERFPVAGAEDQEFSLRARAGGCQLLLDTRIQCWHNDNRLTLEAYCSREERSAQTMPFLARKYTEQFGEVPYVRENRPVRTDDSLALIAKKLLKALLASSPLLSLLHRSAAALEAVRAPEQLLRRVYSMLLGLHLYKGFRRSWKG
jgi:GT2 family glycosyltransferase